MGSCIFTASANSVACTLVSVVRLPNDTIEDEDSDDDNNMEYTDTTNKRANPVHDGGDCANVDRGTKWAALDREAALRLVCSRSGLDSPSKGVRFLEHFVSCRTAHETVYMEYACLTYHVRVLFWIHRCECHHVIYILSFIVICLLNRNHFHIP